MNNMTKGIITLGEALIDFIPTDHTNMTYQKNPGGAPANVAVGAARLGAKSTFLSKVGQDVLGRFLKETLTNYGVETSNMSFSDDANTNIVFVTLDENGERSFEFYVNPSADQKLSKSDIHEDVFAEHNVFHFGSISLIKEPARSATMYAVEQARKAGVMVSYDPNLRMSLWDSEEQAREQMVSVFNQVDVLKISEEELEFITGEHSIEKGIEKLKEQYNIPLIFVTLGAEGSYVFTEHGSAQVDALQVEAVDTTGAGDAFVSGILYQLSERSGDILSISVEDAVYMARFASVSGGLAASSKGAMTALPDRQHVKNILENGQ